MYHVTKYSTIRGVFRGGSNGVCQGLLRLRRHLESRVDPGNEVAPRTGYSPVQRPARAKFMRTSLIFHFKAARTLSNTSQHDRLVNC